MLPAGAAAAPTRPSPGPTPLAPCQRRTGGPRGPGLTDLKPFWALAPRHADHAGRNVHAARPDGHELRVTTADAFDRVAVLLEFSRCTFALHRQKSTSDGHQRKAPAGQVGQARHGASGDEVGSQLPQNACALPR